MSFFYSLQEPVHKQKYFITLNMDFARSSLGYYKRRVGNRISGKLRNTHRLLGNRFAKFAAGPSRQFAQTWGRANENTYNQVRKTLENNERKLETLKANYTTTLESIRSIKILLKNLNRRRNSNFRLTGKRIQVDANRSMNQGTQTNNRTWIQYNGRLSNNVRRAALINQLKHVHNVNELQKLSTPQLVEMKQNSKRKLV